MKQREYLYILEIASAFIFLQNTDVITHLWYVVFYILHVRLWGHI